MSGMPIAGVDTAGVQPDLGAVLDLLEDLGPGVVDQCDPVADENLGSQIGVAPGYRCRGVDDPGDVGRHERVRGGPIEIQHIDDDDVAGLDPVQEPVDVPFHPGGAQDTGTRAAVTCEERCHPHGADSVGASAIVRGGAP